MEGNPTITESWIYWSIFYLLGEELLLECRAGTLPAPSGHFNVTSETMPRFSVHSGIYSLINFKKGLLFKGGSPIFQALL